MRWMKWRSHLLGAQHDRDHALRLSGLGALVDEDGSELHLGQTRVSRPNAGAADHIGILAQTIKLS